MGHYDLNRMGWQQFEHMLQALAKAELGNGVYARLGPVRMVNATQPLKVGSLSLWAARALGMDTASSR